MKKIVMLFCLLIPVFTFAQQPVVIELNEGWQFTQTGKDEWRNAEIPGSVQRDLIHNGLSLLAQQKCNGNENWDFKKRYGYRPIDTTMPCSKLDMRCFSNGAKSAKTCFGYRVP